MADIRIALGFTKHPKTIKLRRRLGLEGCWALLDLWTWAGDCRQSGDLSDMTEEDIAIAACWARDPAELVATLIDLRWIDRDESGGLRLHDWSEHQPWLVGAERRSEVASERAKARWEKREAASLGIDVEVLRARRNAQSNAPRIAPRNATEHAGSMLLSVSVSESVSVPKSESDSNVGSTASPVVVPTPEASAHPVLVNAPAEWESDLESVRKHLDRIQAPGEFHDPAYWRQIEAWLGAHPTIGYLDELAKYLNNEQGKNRRRQHKNLRAGFSNWLRTAERIADREAQKRQQWQRR